MTSTGEGDCAEPKAILLSPSANPTDTDTTYVVVVCQNHAQITINRIRESMDETDQTPGFPGRVIENATRDALSFCRT